MKRLTVIAGPASLLVILELSTAVAQSNLSPAVLVQVDAWKICVEAAAARYAASNEPAENVARLAILSCKPALMKLGVQMNAENMSMSFQNGFIEQLEKRTFETTAVH